MHVADQLEMPIERKKRTDERDVRDIIGRGFASMASEIAEGLRQAVESEVCGIESDEDVDFVQLNYSIDEAVKDQERDFTDHLLEMVGNYIESSIEEIGNELDAARAALRAVLDATGLDARDVRARDGRWLGPEVAAALGETE